MEEGIDRIPPGAGGTGQSRRGDATAIITDTEEAIADIRTARDAAVMTADIIVSMRIGAEVGIGINAADIILLPLHLHHRVVGHLRDHLMIGREIIDIAAEKTPDAVGGMIVEAVRKVHQPMFIHTSSAVAKIQVSPLHPSLLIQTNLNVFGMVSNGLFVLHNRYRLPICK